MKKQINHVTEFHKAFGHPINDRPTLLPEAITNLRYDLMKEENEEYLEACQAGDLVGVADALGDQLYILCGSLIAHGMQHKIEEIFDEIQRSNMSKLDENGKAIINGENGVFDSSKPWGKVLKSLNFTEPNLKQFI